VRRASRLLFCGAVQLMYKVDENFDAEIVLFLRVVLVFILLKNACTCHSVKEPMKAGASCACWVFMFIFIFVY